MLCFRIAVEQKLMLSSRVDCGVEKRRICLFRCQREGHKPKPKSEWWRRFLCRSFLLACLAARMLSLAELFVDWEQPQNSRQAPLTYFSCTPQNVPSLTGKPLSNATVGQEAHRKTQTPTYFSNHVAAQSSSGSSLPALNSSRLGDMDVPAIQSKESITKFQGALSDASVPAGG